MVRTPKIGNSDGSTFKDQFVWRLCQAKIYNNIESFKVNKLVKQLSW